VTEARAQSRTAFRAVCICVRRSGVAWTAQASIGGSGPNPEAFTPVVEGEQAFAVSSA